jgi:hypothetical protein
MHDLHYFITVDKLDVFYTGTGKEEILASYNRYFEEIVSLAVSIFQNYVNRCDENVEV